MAPRAGSWFGRAKAPPLHVPTTPPSRAAWLAQGVVPLKAQTVTFLRVEIAEPLPFPADAGFELVSEIGRGGSGIVYAVRKEDRELALKLPQSDLGERDRANFLREAALLQRAAHPGVVEVLDAGTLSDGRPYLLMPILRGASLADFLVRRGSLSTDAALALFLPLAEAVAHLHALGLVHRDIKPENVFYLDADEKLVLLDFGIARETNKAPSTTTQANVVRGTPATMAPERFFGARASESSDAYELALVLYAMLTGALPWGESTDASERLSPKAPSELGVDVPAGVEAVILEALSTRPERRPTVRALIERLGGERASVPISSAGRRTADLPSRPRPSALVVRPSDHDLPSEEEALAMLADVVGSARRKRRRSRRPGRRPVAPSSKGLRVVEVGSSRPRSVPRSSSERWPPRAWPPGEPASSASPSAPSEAAIPGSRAVTALASASGRVVADPPSSASAAPSAAGPTALSAPSSGAPSSSAVPSSSALARDPAKDAARRSPVRRVTSFGSSRAPTTRRWSEYSCKAFREGTLEENYSATEEARCRSMLSDLRAREAAPAPTDAQAGLVYCAKLRDAYCSPELKSLWVAKTLCAQGEALYEQNKSLPPSSWKGANDQCAQMLPGLTATSAEVVPRHFVATARLEELNAKRSRRSLVPKHSRSMRQRVRPRRHIGLLAPRPSKV